MIRFGKSGLGLVAIVALACTDTSSGGAASGGSGAGSPATGGASAAGAAAGGVGPGGASAGGIHAGGATSGGANTGGANGGATSGGTSTASTGGLAGASACDGPNPAGCIVEGCPQGQACFTGASTCEATTCHCDTSTRQWACSSSCTPGTCMAASSPCFTMTKPAICDAACKTKGCPTGQVCLSPSKPCVPSQCGCNESGGWWATSDCYGGNCVPADSDCVTKPNPQGCSSAGCPQGQVCAATSGVCVPSSCSCDVTTGKWACTADCTGGACVPG
jgi:hypothetical protein